jgi:hypothetical protein
MILMWGNRSTLHPIQIYVDWPGVVPRPLRCARVPFIKVFKMDVLLYLHEAFNLPISYEMLLCTQKSAVSHILYRD